jgi:hypothetical protein
MYSYPRLYASSLIKPLLVGFNHSMLLLATLFPCSVTTVLMVTAERCLGHTCPSSLLLRHRSTRFTSMPTSSRTEEPSLSLKSDVC